MPDQPERMRHCRDEAPLSGGHKTAGGRGVLMDEVDRREEPRHTGKPLVMTMWRNRGCHEGKEEPKGTYIAARSYKH